MIGLFFALLPAEGIGPVHSGASSGGMGAGTHSLSLVPQWCCVRYQNYGPEPYWDT